MRAHNLPIEAIAYIVIDTLLQRLVWCNTKHALIKESLIYARHILHLKCLRCLNSTRYISSKLHL